MPGIALGTGTALKRTARPLPACIKGEIQPAQDCEPERASTICTRTETARLDIGPVDTWRKHLTAVLPQAKAPLRLGRLGVVENPLLHPAVRQGLLYNKARLLPELYRSQQSCERSGVLCNHETSQGPCLYTVRRTTLTQG